MTKIDIISGFLGAGKTTLIKKLLKEAFAGEQLVLIENEFGEISIDGGFLKESGVQISEMSSGCICCSLVGDFNQALKDVQQQFHPDRILIEPSGVGKLSDVIVAVENTVAETSGMALNSFVTVADATKVKIYMKNFGEFYNNQIESAGTIILSRTQKLSPEKLESAVAMLREKNPTAAILTTPWDQLDGKTVLSAIEKVSLADELLAKMRAEHEAEEAEHAHHHHDHEHEHEHHHDHDEHDHDHEHVDSLGDDGHEEEIEYDEHIWTSPKNAMVIVEEIRDKLTQMDPDGASVYEENAEVYLEKLSRLDQEFEQVAADEKRNMIIIGGKFPFRYLAEAYGFEYRAAFSGCSTDTEPSARTIAYLIDRVKEYDIPVVYYLELSSTRVAEIIGEETGADILLLHSCHNVTRREFDAGVTYLELMEQNVENLRKGLDE